MTTREQLEQEAAELWPLGKNVSHQLANFVKDKRDAYIRGRTVTDAEYRAAIDEVATAYSLDHPEVAEMLVDGFRAAGLIVEEAE